MIRRGESAACPSKATIPGCQKSSIVSDLSLFVKADLSSMVTPLPVEDQDHQTHQILQGKLFTSFSPFNLN